MEINLFETGNNDRFFGISNESGTCRIRFKTICPYLRENESLSYCRAWDEFCGVRTDGLWTEEEKSALKIEAQINDLEGYRIAICFLNKQYSKTHSSDIENILIKMPFIN